MSHERRNADIIPVGQELNEVLANIVEASDRLEAKRLEYHARPLLWELEVFGRLSTVDADNFRLIFQAALAKRLFELKQR